VADDDNGVTLSRIGQIAIIVHDLPRAVTFYRDVLRMKFLFEAPNLAFFECGGVRLMLGLPDKAELDHPGSILYFVVEDIERAFQTLSGRGVTFEDRPHLVARLPDHELWMTFFRDLDSNVLALMAERRP
jgi:methylmalonyl-CoA/ethylmalonyl-CoA epimerase